MARVSVPTLAQPFIQIKRSCLLQPQALCRAFWEGVSSLVQVREYLLDKMEIAQTCVVLECYIPTKLYLSGYGWSMTSAMVVAIFCNCWSILRVSKECPE